MAIAVIGGLIVSTVLSLVFVPAAFTVLEISAASAGVLVGRFVGEKAEPEARAVNSTEPRWDCAGYAPASGQLGPHSF